MSGRMTMQYALCNMRCTKWRISVRISAYFLGASIWFIVEPIRDMDFDLNKSESRSEMLWNPGATGKFLIRRLLVFAGTFAMWITLWYANGADLLSIRGGGGVGGGGGWWDSESTI